MQKPRRAVAALSIVLLPVVPMAVSSPAAEGARPARDQAAAVDTVLDWQLISLRTVYTENATPVPVGTLYLGFTALAVYDAATQAIKRGSSSARAAVATAAHDVLAEYFPGSQANLDADLASTLAAVPDNPAQAKGIRIGRRAADAMIASREGDGRNDPQRAYELDPSDPGVWAPAALPGGMLAPWLGYVDPLIVPTHVAVDGPPLLDSEEFARDFNEVKVHGSASNPDTDEQAIAHFFYFNSIATYDRALVAYLRDNPMSLDRTSRMLAVIHGAAADAIRTTWKLKREVGFWRPIEAIHRADEDANDATVADPGWLPFRDTPPYSEYTTGHGALTGAFAETVRMYLGNSVALHLVSGPVPPTFSIPPDRDYDTLTDLEFDARNARIFAGIHFGDSMDDGYFLAHETARRAEALLD